MSALGREPASRESLRDLIETARSSNGDSLGVGKVNERLYVELGHLAKHFNGILQKLESIEPPVEKTVRETPMDDNPLADIARLTEEGTHRVMEYTETVLENHDLMMASLENLKESLKSSSGTPGKEPETDRIGRLIHDNKKILMDLFSALSFQDLAAQRVKKIRVDLQEVESRILKLVIIIGVDIRGKTMTTERQESLLTELEASSKTERLDQKIVDDVLKEFGF